MLMRQTFILKGLSVRLIWALVRLTGNRTEPDSISVMHVICSSSAVPVRNMYSYRKVGGCV